jgi:hypothetical protein
MYGALEAPNGRSPAGSHADTAKRHITFADEKIPSRPLALGNFPLNALTAEHIDGPCTNPLSTTPTQPINAENELVHST